ncbi:Rieske 2Fe-2S domain-containing protein [Bartonella sp. LJL80]
MTETLFWHAVALSRKVKTKPIRIMFEDEPLVIFRNSTGLNCLRDICPHRGASLSKGRVRKDDIECPYHGWRFNGQGHCTHLPLYSGETPRRFVRAYDVCERFGLIFITKDKDKARPITDLVWDGQKAVTVVMESMIESTLADVIENALDPTHTVFVHEGLVRGSKGDRNKLTLSAGIENGILIINHQGEKKQNGIISRLLEGERSHAINRFAMPGNLSLEYYSATGLNLVFTMYFTRSESNHFMAFAVMRGPRQKGLGYLKAILFITIMRKVFEQDKAIMSDALANMRRAGYPPYARSPLDIFRPMIEDIIASKGSLMDRASIEIKMDI